MNLIDRIYRYRDIKIEREGLKIILPEDEFKKHQKDGTFPTPAVAEAAGNGHKAGGGQ